MTFRTTKPLKRKVDKCDCCKAKEGVAECFFPYGKGHRGVWLDLCATCQTAMIAIPDKFVSLDRSICSYLPSSQAVVLTKTVL